MNHPATHPHHHVPLNEGKVPPWAHVLELAAPLALGQRGLVCGPGGSGRTTVLQHLASCLARSVDRIECVLVDVRIEEQVAWRELLPDARIHASDASAGPEEHAELTACFADALPAADQGAHVGIVVDSLGGLARALNAVDTEVDRVLSGGLAATALQELRRCFAVARALEGAGSVTVLATAPSGDAAELDAVLVEELVGTGNAEWRLQSVPHAPELLPLVDIERSGSRFEEEILGEAAAARRGALRGRLLEHGGLGGLGLLEDQLERLGGLDAMLDALR